MKTKTVSRFHLLKIVAHLSFLLLIFFWASVQNAYAAGAPARSSKSADEKRAEANVYFETGRTLQDAGNYLEASKNYEKSVKADPEYAEAWSNLGYTYRKQGHFNKAVKAYKKAIKIDPDLAEAHEYLGEAYAEKGKFDLAEKELKILRDLGSDEAGELEAFIAEMKAKENSG